MKKGGRGQKENIFLDFQRGVVVAKYHELKEEGKKQPPKKTLCSLEEMYYKVTTNGQKKRTEAEQKNYIDQLYKENLKELRQTIQKKAEKKSESIYTRKVMQLWLDHLTEFRHPRTIQAYTITTNFYIEAIGDHPINDFRRHYTKTLIEFLKVRQANLTTQRKHIRHLQGFFNWALQEEYIDRSIKLDRPRGMKKKEPLIYTQEDLDDIEKLIRKKIDEATRKNHRMYRVNHLRAFMMFRYSIMRRGEVFFLPLNNVDLNGGFINLREVKEKGWIPKNKQEELIPVTDKLIEFLKGDFASRGPSEIWYLDNGEGEICYSDELQLTRAFGSYVSELKLPKIKPIHGIRATGITLLLKSASPAVVRSIARHKSITTTMSYENSEQTETKSVMDLL